MWHKSVPPSSVAIGDLVMKSNPAYGFGATRACVGVVTFAGLLASIQSTEVPPFFVGYRCPHSEFIGNGNFIHANDRAPDHMQVCRSDTVILRVGCNAPVDTVLCFASRAVNESLVLGRHRLSFLSCTEFVSPLCFAYQSASNVLFVIVVTSLGVS
jgi:hypothetical protein